MCMLEIFFNSSPNNSALQWHTLGRIFIGIYRLVIQYLTFFNCN